MQNNEEETPDNNVTDEIEEQQHGGRHDIEIIAGAQAGLLVEEVDHADDDEDDFDDHGAGDNDARTAANHVTDDARAAANHVTYKSASANHDSAHFQPLNSINQFLSSYSNEEDGEDNIIDEDHDQQNHDNDDDEDEAAVEGNQTISFEFKYYCTKGTIHK